MKESPDAVKGFLTSMILFASPFAMMFIFVYLAFEGVWPVTIIMGLLILPLIIPFLWLKKKKVYLIAYISYLLCFAILLGTQFGMKAYNESITIDVAPDIDTYEYMPFADNSKIVKLKSKTLSFRETPVYELPVIDGATAAFPVYSAFVNAVYPETTELHGGVFEFNNTRDGYRKLAKKKTDIFIGAQPSAKQVKTAKKHNTTFKYTQIGYEAFVFFVHKDNPIESLTAQQIKGIYSGEITNWKEVGGKNEEIVAFQRSEGSGSQSMLIRFMGDKPIMDAPTEEVVDGMGGIIEEVANYKSKTNSIGFSFRYYVEGMIKNPDIKLIAIEGIKPDKENIRNGNYPIIAPVYAVTYEENENENVQKLVDWMLSSEGQYIIEETGYVGMKK
ncbi:MAG: substrate-binding domain-containing protein [Clostridia bacterium]|nr:substrate-binding domain-containing protein [Clostridia bacterium]